MGIIWTCRKRQLLNNNNSRLVVGRRPELDLKCRHRDRPIIVIHQWWDPVTLHLSSLCRPMSINRNIKTTTIACWVSVARKSAPSVRKNWVKFLFLTKNLLEFNWIFKNRSWSGHDNWESATILPHQLFPLLRMRHRLGQRHGRHGRSSP